MPNEYVQARLLNWARWLDQRWSGGLGYPKRNILAAHHGTSASTDVWQEFSVIDSTAASETHAAVRELCLSQSHLWLAVVCRYVGDPQAPARRRRAMTHMEIAARMGISAQTAREYVRQAEGLVDASLRAGREREGVLPISEKP